VELPFAPAEKTDALDKTIYRNVPEFLDVLWIDHWDQVQLAAKWLPSLVDETLFWGTGQYHLRLAVVSDAPAVEYDFVLHWTEQRLTATAACTQVTRSTCATPGRNGTGPIHA
jgi:hypothetical protein